jgi:hypothetical protein
MRQISLSNIANKNLTAQLSGIKALPSPTVAIRIRSDTQLPGSYPTLLKPSKLDVKSKSQYLSIGQLGLGDLATSEGYGQEVFEASIIGKLQSPTFFGKQITCVAEYWLAQKIREEGENRGNFVDTLETSYTGNTAVHGEAWCAMFVWFIIDEACKTLGIPNCFPSGYDVLGNVNKTVQQCLSVYENDWYPVAGAAHRRNSSGGHAHMGIIDYVDEENKLFYVVEGNVKLSDGGEGIGFWEYTFDDINSYAFRFIHTEKQCNGQTPVTVLLPYKEKQCQPEPEKPKEPEEPKKGETPDIAVKKSLTSGESDSCTDNKFFKKLGLPQTDEDLQKQIAEKGEADIINRCQQITQYMPSSDDIMHFSMLSNPVIIDDIFGTNFSGKSNEIIAGSALGYIGNSQQIPIRTGFGIFKDKAGNLIYILDSDSDRAKQLIHNKHIGPTQNNSNFEDGKEEYLLLASYNTFIIEHIYNSEERAKAYFPKSDSRWLYGTLWRNQSGLKKKGGIAALPKDNRIYLPDGTNYIQIRGQFDWWETECQTIKTGTFSTDYVDCVHIYSLLTFIEQICLGEIFNVKPTKLTEPIVIYCRSKRVATWQTELMDMMNICASVASFVPIPGVSTLVNLIKTAATTLINLSYYGLNSFDRVFELVNTIYKCCELIAPEEVKGVQNYFLNKAKEATTALTSEGNALLNWTGASEILNIPSTFISQIQKKYINSVAIGFSDPLSSATKYITENFSENIKILQNFSNSILTHSISKQVTSGKFIMDLTSALKITDVPIFQDVFITGASNSILTGLPNIKQLSTLLLSKDEIVENIKDLAGDSFNSIKVAIIKSAFGYIPNPCVFDKITLASLQQKAVDTLSNNNFFVLPHSIPKEKAICWKYELEHNDSYLKKKIIYCSDGWDWDAQLQKCVLKGKVYVPGYKGNCITEEGNKYYFNDGTNEFEAIRDFDDKFYLKKNGDLILINADCSLTIKPPIPNVPNVPFVPPTTPGVPGVPPPTTPNVPNVPFVPPTTPNIPTTETPSCFKNIDGNLFFSYKVSALVEAKDFPVRKNADGTYEANITNEGISGWVEIDVTKCAPRCIYPAIEGAFYFDWNGKGYPAFYKDNFWYTYLTGTWGFGIATKIVNCKPEQAPETSENPDCFDTDDSGMLYYKKFSNTAKTMYQKFNARKNADGTYEAFIDGAWIQIVNCLPKLPEVPTPPPPETKKLPDCIKIIDNAYYFIDGTDKFPAGYEATTDQWFAQTKDGWLKIIDCKIDYSFFPNKEKLPPCIWYIDKFFYYKDGDLKYLAGYDASSKKWYVETPDGWLELIDCRPQTPAPRPPKDCCEETKVELMNISKYLQQIQSQDSTQAQSTGADIALIKQYLEQIEKQGATQNQNSQSELAVIKEYLENSKTQGAQTQQILQTINNYIQQSKVESQKSLVEKANEEAAKTFTETSAATAESQKSLVEKAKTEQQKPSSETETDIFGEKSLVESQKSSVEKESDKMKYIKQGYGNCLDCPKMKITKEYWEYPKCDDQCAECLD